MSFSVKFARARHAMLPVALAASLMCVPPTRASEAGPSVLVWSSGTLSGLGLPLVLSDAVDLQIVTGGVKYFNADLTTLGDVLATDHVYFQSYGGTRTWTNAGQFDLSGDVGFHDGGYGGAFSNVGSLSKVAGLGTSSISGVAFSNSGLLAVHSGSMDFKSGTATFAGSSTIHTESGAKLSFSGGHVTFQDGVQFTGGGLVSVATGATMVGQINAQQLLLSAGTHTGGNGSAGSGATLVTGLTQWSGGTLAGQWALDTGRQLNLTAGRTHYLNANFNNLGVIAATDSLYLQSMGGAHVLDNQGTIDLQADVGVYDGGYGGTVINRGSLRKSAGDGTSSISGVTVVNQGGIIDVSRGVLNFSGGSLAFNDGTRFVGSGQSRVSSGATFQGAIGSQNLVLAGGTHVGGGNTHGQATLSGQVGWSGSGSLAGNWTLTSGSTLALQGGGTKYINANVLNEGSVTTRENIYLQSYGGTHTVSNAGHFDLQGDIGLHDGGYGGVFANSGTLQKSAGTGTSRVGGVVFSSTGVLDVQSGAMEFYSGSATFQAGSTVQTAADTSLLFSGGHVAFLDGVQFLGTGQITVATNATMVGSITAHDLILAAGTHAGGDGSVGSMAALVTGAARWTGGTLSGDWYLETDHQLDIAAGRTKYLNANLANVGTITLQDHLYFQGYGGAHTLDNKGLLDVRGDVQLTDGGYSGTLHNKGVLRKSGGAGVASISSLTVVNDGTIDVSSGELHFLSGSLAFNQGTSFTGAGRTVISTGATFQGDIASENLTLGGGSHRGGGSTHGQARLSGTVTWAGAGTLRGQWEVAGGSTLALQGGGTKYLNADLVNRGTLVSAETVYVQSYGGTHTLRNEGLLELQGSAGFADGGYGGVITNQGTLRKTGGGLSVIRNVSFAANEGVIDVADGQLQLPSSLSNVGTVMGQGTLITASLRNAGHVAPGASPGTLTLSGNYVQLASGALDIELASASSFDALVVSGSASLDGALNVLCFGACQLNVGDTFTIVDAANGALSGTFASVSLSGLRGANLDVIYDLARGDVRLTVTQGNVTAVPEAQSWALALAGLGVALWSVRRRRQG